MTDLFIDTGAWVAVADRSDNLHSVAVKFYRQVFSLYRRLVTTSFVLAESYALLRRAFSADVVLEWLNDVLASPRVEVVYDNQDLLDAGRTILARYADHTLSLVDAVSFAVMRSRGMKQAFAFDQHFQIAGFALVPKR